MKVTLTIETGVSFYTAIFKRQYSADVEVVDGKVMLYDVRKEDFVPSGYAHGGTRVVICESFECKGSPVERINDRELMRAWLAHVALVHDVELEQVSPCSYLTESRRILLCELEDRFEDSEVDALVLAHS